MIFTIIVVSNSVRPVDPLHKFGAKLRSLEFGLVTMEPDGSFHVFRSYRAQVPRDAYLNMY